MRIIRYSSRLEIEPWMSFYLVPLHEIKEAECPAKVFDKVVAAIKAANFDYVVVDQPAEVLIERGDAVQQSASKDSK